MDRKCQVRMDYNHCSIGFPYFVTVTIFFYLLNLLNQKKHFYKECDIIQNENTYLETFQPSLIQWQTKPHGFVISAISASSKRIYIISSQFDNVKGSSELGLEEVHHSFFHFSFSLTPDRVNNCLKNYRRKNREVMSQVVSNKHYKMPLHT